MGRAPNQELLLMCRPVSKATKRTITDKKGMFALYILQRSHSSITPHKYILLTLLRVFLCNCTLQYPFRDAW